MHDTDAIVPVDAGGGDAMTAAAGGKLQVPGARPTHHSPRRQITRAACLGLLTPGGHGRVAASMQAVPVIIPVTFSLFGDDVVFSPGPGEGEVRAIANSVVAFETDTIGSDGLTRWDVHVTGVARTHNDSTDAPAFRLSSEIMTGWRAGP